MVHSFNKTIYLKKYHFTFKNEKTSQINVIKNSTLKT